MGTRAKGGRGAVATLARLNLPFADVRKYFSLRPLMKMNGLVILLASDNENPASHKATHTGSHTHTLRERALLMMSGHSGTGSLKIVPNLILPGKKNVAQVLQRNRPT